MAAPQELNLLLLFSTTGNSPKASKALIAFSMATIGDRGGTRTSLPPTMIQPPASLMTPVKICAIT
jgi:hypothetical protein